MSPRDRPTPTSVTLGLTLTAIPPDDDEDMLFPLARGSIMARATFTDMQGGDDNFEDAFTDYVTVFNIRPAQCELLFPVVTVRPMEAGTGKRQSPSPTRRMRTKCEWWSDVHLLWDGGCGGAV